MYGSEKVNQCYQIQMSQMASSNKSAENSVIQHLDI